MKVVKALTSALSLFVVIVSQSANAGSILRISDGVPAHTVVVTDPDLDADGETMAFHSAGMGTWNLAFSLATGNNGSVSGLPSMELSATAFGRGKLDVWFIQDGFTLTPASITSTLGSTMAKSAGTGSYIIQETCVLDGNTNFDCNPATNSAASPLSHSQVNAPTTIAGLVEEKLFPGDGNTTDYAIAIHVIFNHLKLAHSSIDSNIVVPAPATLALVLIGFLGLGAARRKGQIV